MGEPGVEAGRLLKCDNAEDTLRDFIVVGSCTVPSVPTLPSVGEVQNSLTVPVLGRLLETCCHFMYIHSRVARARIPCRLYFFLRRCTVSVR